MIQFMILKGASVNHEDHQKVTPLIYGVKYPHYENIEVLLDNGAKIDAVTDSGMTALMWASSFGYLPIV